MCPGVFYLWGSIYYLREQWNISPNKLTFPFSFYFTIRKKNPHGDLQFFLSDFLCLCASRPQQVYIQLSYTSRMASAPCQTGDLLRVSMAVLIYDINLYKERLSSCFAAFFFSFMLSWWKELPQFIKANRMLPSLGEHPGGKHFHVGVDIPCLCHNNCKNTNF